LNILGKLSNARSIGFGLFFFGNLLFFGLGSYGAFAQGEFVGRCSLGFGITDVRFHFAT
jgi:hypothetical protein